MAKTKEAELPLLIMNAGRLLVQRLHCSGERCGVSMLHLKIMAFISLHQSASMKQIAEFLGITPPSATVLVNRLVRSGELKRLQGKDDKRTVLVAATPAGRRGILRHRQAMSKRLGTVLGRLSADEKIQLASTLKRLTERDTI